MSNQNNSDARLMISYHTRLTHTSTILLQSSAKAKKSRAFLASASEAFQLVQSREHHAEKFELFLSYVII